MKFTNLISRFFGMIGKIVQLIEQWVSMLFDWTGELKETSDEALKRYKIEREAEDEIAMQELQERIAKRNKERADA